MKPGGVYNGFVKKGIVAVLVNIRSIHNVGSIFRTADAAGVSKLYLLGITPTPFDRLGNLRPQFAKVALGAEENVAWEKLGSAPKARAKLFTDLKREGYVIYAVEQTKKSTPYFKVRARKPKIALIFGNEVRGLPLSILKQADRILEIPMFGKKESLNVAVAFGIVAYHFRIFGG